MPEACGDASFSVLKFDMRSPADRAACGRMMSEMGTMTVAGCDTMIRLAQVNIIQKRAEVRRALRRQPSPDAHLIGTNTAGTGLTLRRLCAEIEQRVYLNRWEEARRLCWSIRCTRRGLAELVERRDRLRMEQIMQRDHQHPSIQDAA